MARQVKREDWQFWFVMVAGGILIGAVIGSVFAMAQAAAEIAGK